MTPGHVIVCFIEKTRQTDPEVVLLSRYSVKDTLKGPEMLT